MADAGIMFALRWAMIHSEPETTSVTTSSPKASASTLLVLSGPVPICRKNTWRQAQPLGRRDGTLRIKHARLTARGEETGRGGGRENEA